MQPFQKGEHGYARPACLGVLGVCLRENQGRERKQKYWEGGIPHAHSDHTFRSPQGTDGFPQFILPQKYSYRDHKCLTTLIHPNTLMTHPGLWAKADI